MSELRGRRALVLGLGRFDGGVGATRFLVEEGALVRVADRQPAAALESSVGELADLPRERLELCLAREDDSLLDEVELVVVNPAVPPSHPLLAEAARRRIPLTQELDLFLRHYPGLTVGVTGTNGKSTAAALLHAALTGGGRRSLLGGNIGRSLLRQRSLWDKDTIAVVEVSSFQLERLSEKFHGALVTHVTSDHLDRHGSVEAYRAAKARLLQSLHPPPGGAAPFACINREDPVSAAFVLPPAVARVAYSLLPPPRGEVGLEDGFLVSRLDGDPRRLVHERALRLPGRFNVRNAAGCLACALVLGAGPHGAALAVAGFRGLPHRMSLLDRIDGVLYVDNGVSTVLESTASAIVALGGRVHWVGGGRQKGPDLALFAEEISARVVSAHLFGEVAPKLGPLIAGRRHDLPVSASTTLEEALEQARAAAGDGDTVLFSPGFSSYDQFANFRERAAAAGRWVEKLRPAGSERARCAT